MTGLRRTFTLPSMRVIGAIPAFTLAGLLLGCGRSHPSEPPSSEAEQESTNYPAIRRPPHHVHKTAPARVPARPQRPAAVVETEAGTAGTTTNAAANCTITGQVFLYGTPPRANTIDFTADAVCASLHTEPLATETVLVNEDGGLRNVFVYVKQGLPDRRFEPPTRPATLKQRGCIFRPHVMGLQVGQLLEIVNDDPTAHYVHALPAINEEFSRGEPEQGTKVTHRFSSPEVMVKLKCDLHPWMNAYIGVLNHPFFSVTGSDGSFTLSRLPAGDYVIEAWHELYGTQAQTVTVRDGETKEIEFEFGE